MQLDTNTNLLRIPLSWSQDQRQASIAKDARRVNVLDESSDNRRFVTKRSGLTLVAALGAGLGQGLVDFNNVVYAVIDDAFKVALGSAPLSGASGVTWTEQVPLGFVPWAPRGAYAAVVLGDAIYVIAGSNTGPGINVPDVWTSSDGVNWRQCTGAAPFGPRTGCNAVVLNGKIYVAGGVTPAGVYLNDVWSSPDGTVWTQETADAGWTARETFGMVVTSNGIFIMGGVDNTTTALNDVWFSSDGATWTEIPAASPWPARSKMGTAVLNNKLYVIAGYDDGTATALNDVWESDNGTVWTAISGAAFPTARFGMSCVVYNNKIWALGGFDTAELSDVVGSIDGVTWTTVATSPGWAGRYEGAAVVFRTPDGERYASIWVLPGVGVSSPDDIWAATLDTAISSSTALVPGVAGQPYQFNSFLTGTALLIKNQSDLWVYAAGAVNKVTDVGYPLETVPGLVVLGGFAYVMDPSGLIYNCALDDPTYWPSLNVLGADYEDDAGVALVKYLNYVIAFGSYTTQMFYDAGLPYGSPLAPYLNANITVGCADAESIAYCGPTLAWVAQTRQGNKQAVVMEGFAPRPISNSFIDKFLNAEVGGFKAFSCTMKGQMFYVVTCVAQAISWAYSFTTQQWYEFSRGLPFAATTTFAFAGYTYDLAFAQYVLTLDTGAVYRIDDAALVDGDGVPFPVYLRTIDFDAGNNRRKFWGRLDIIGDKNVGTPSISYTDDDYQTYSTARTVDMDTNRPALFRMGSSRRRAWVYEQLDANMMRLEALEQQYEQGN